MATNPQQFPFSMRFFHWLVAAMVLTMLGIGVTMVASLAHYHQLISIHRPLGTLLLILVAIRSLTGASAPYLLSLRRCRLGSASLQTGGKSCCTHCCFCSRWSAGGCYPRRATRSDFGVGCIFSPSFRTARCCTRHCGRCTRFSPTSYSSRSSPILELFSFTHGSCGIGCSAAWRLGGSARATGFCNTAHYSMSRCDNRVVELATAPGRNQRGHRPAFQKR